MALDDDIRVLSGVGIFSALNPDQLRLLAFGAESMRMPAGRDIYREGEAADCAYIVVSGAVTLHRDGADGEPQTLSRLGPGAIMGELALIAETTRLSHASAETDAALLRLSRTLFRRILEEYPETAAELHRRMSQDLHAFLRRIERLGSRFAD